MWDNKDENHHSSEFSQSGSRAKSKNLQASSFYLWTEERMRSPVALRVSFLKLWPSSLFSSHFLQHIPNVLILAKATIRPSRSICPTRQRAITPFMVGQIHTTLCLQDPERRTWQMAAPTVAGSSYRRGCFWKHIAPNPFTKWSVLVWTLGGAWTSRLSIKTKCM